MNNESFLTEEQKAIIEENNRILDKEASSKQERAERIKRVVEEVKAVKDEISSAPYRMLKKILGKIFTPDVLATIYNRGIKRLDEQRIRNKIFKGYAYRRLNNGIRHV